MKRAVIASFFVLVAGLLLYVVASLRSDRDYARQKTRSDISYLQTGVEVFKYDCGRYPTPEEGLSILVTSNNIPGWRSHYLPRPISSDFWGTPYRYRLVDGKPSIVSAGKDKVFDTADDISH
jgi:general secretion pathway protein G